MTARTAERVGVGRGRTERRGGKERSVPREGRKRQIEGRGQHGLPLGRHRPDTLPKRAAETGRSGEDPGREEGDKREDHEGANRRRSGV